MDCRHSPDMVKSDDWQALDAHHRFTCKCGEKIKKNIHTDKEFIYFFYECNATSDPSTWKCPSCYGFGGISFNETKKCECGAFFLYDTTYKKFILLSETKLSLENKLKEIEECMEGCVPKGMARALLKGYLKQDLSEALSIIRKHKASCE